MHRDIQRQINAHGDKLLFVQFSRVGFDSDIRSARRHRPVLRVQVLVVQGVHFLHNWIVEQQCVDHNGPGSGALRCNMVSATVAISFGLAEGVQDHHRHLDDGSCADHSGDLDGEGGEDRPIPDLFVRAHSGCADHQRRDGYIDLRGPVSDHDVRVCNDCV